MASLLVGELINVAKQVGDVVGRVFKDERTQDAPPVPQINIDMKGAKPGGLVAMTCPKCNASIQAPAGRNVFYCSYCGSQLLVDDGSATVTYRMVDETKIKQAELKEELELKRLEIEEARRPIRMKLMAVLGIFGVLAVLVGSFAGAAVGEDGAGPWFAVSALGVAALFAVAYMGLFALVGNNSRED